METRPVPYSGPEGAELWLVGEAPGQEEVRQGSPFVGPSGRLLRGLLGEAGIRDTRCRFANVVCYRPPSNKFTELPPSTIEDGTARLREAIRREKPKVVVSLGAQPTAALLPEFAPKISKRRGSCYWSEALSCHIIPTYHPAYILRQYKDLVFLRMDLEKAKGVLDNGFTQLKRELITCPSAELSLRILREMRSSTRVAFDLETTYSDKGIPAFPTHFGIADSADHSMCIPFYEDGEQCWSMQVEAELWRGIAELMEDESVEKVAHNSSFDCCVLHHSMGIRTANLIQDTMAAFHLVYPELPKALDSVASMYTDTNYYGDLTKEGSEAFQRYNCLDAALTLEISYALEKEMKEFGTFPLHEKLTLPLLKATQAMQLRGVRVDVDKIDGTKEELQAKLDAAKEMLQDLVREQLEDPDAALNPNSPKQVAELLFDTLGYDKFTKKRTTAAEALENLDRKKPNPILSLIIECKQRQKLISTYLEAPTLNGRMHTSYNIGGAIKKTGATAAETKGAPTTGRLSSSMSLATGSGTNLQNIPRDKEIRALFVPDPGLTWMKIDLSQAEARVVAALANDEKMLEVFSEGKDIHRLTAAWIFQKPYDEVTPSERDFSKTHVHALNYRESAFGFCKRAGLPRRDGDRLIRRYFEAFPGLPRWHQWIEQELKRSRTLSTPFGRKRTFFGRLDDSTLRSATAYIPQSTVGDWLNFALIDLENSPVCDMLLNVHDEVDLQFEYSCLGRVLEEVEKAFDITITIERTGVEFTIPYEVEIGPNWGQVKEIAV